MFKEGEVRGGDQRDQYDYDLTSCKLRGLSGRVVRIRMDQRVSQFAVIEWTNV